ncbi:redoxin domain-containing protein [Stygiolobus azoricus]|uniref:Redoxin domain-containing protein n=1 Tax=Stygiolobus azoricus TaxID=41675 RepID=A0A650CPS1_9CREN|nr:redoxin domain-containing protein [Stygiolobus azoricus]QGR19773.1 redoxin domain-containing protein [Stygiolobus azoricus]
MKLKVGDKAPDFEAEDDEGKRVKLSDFQGKS